MLSHHFDVKVITVYVHPIRNAAIAICILWFVIRWKKAFEQIIFKKAYEKRILDHATSDLISKLSSIVIVAIFLLIILQVLGLNIMPLVAFGGIGAGAIAFAAKDVIANFFGGLMLHITRSFIRRDFVSIPDKKIKGSIEEIGWYVTRIRDLDKNPMYIPNSMFSTSYIINLSRRTHRRIEEKIGVRYKDFSKIPSILEKIKEYLSSEKDVDLSLPLIVRFTSFKDYSLELFLRAYTNVLDYNDFVKYKEKVLFKIGDIIASCDAEMPFPITTVELEKD